MNLTGLHLRSSNSTFPNMKVILAILALCVVGAFSRAFSPVHISKPLNFNITKLPGDTCGGNCPSDDCDSTCPCGDSANPVDPSYWCSLASNWDQNCCQCIINAESGGNANAMNQNNDGSYDVGLWQINSQNWGSCSGGSPPCDPSINFQCAQDVWNWGGGSFKLWSTCGGCGCC